jgi:hypothetical protein
MRNAMLNVDSSEPGHIADPSESGTRIGAAPAMSSSGV